MALPSPSQRQPWYPHMSEPSFSTLPSDSGTFLHARGTRLTGSTKWCKECCNSLKRQKQFGSRTKENAENSNKPFAAPLDQASYVA